MSKSPGHRQHPEHKVLETRVPGMFSAAIVLVCCGAHFSGAGSR